MADNRLELTRALEELALPAERARFCDDETARSVVQRAEEALVKRPGLVWWWTELKVPASFIEYPDCDGWQHLLEYVPTTGSRCWLIVESDRGPFIVMDVVPDVVPEIIGECYPFEYYLIGKQFDWLVAENHHNYLVIIPPCERR